MNNIHKFYTEHPRYAKRLAKQRGFESVEEMIEFDDSLTEDDIRPYGAVVRENIGSIRGL